VEVCGNAVLDEDCSGAPCGGDALWARKAGGSGAQVAQDLAVDTNGNVIVVGYFGTKLTLGTLPTATLTSQGGYDVFVAKLDSDGDPLWASGFGGSSNQQAYSVAVDTTGNLFVAGNFAGSLTAGGTTLTSAGGKTDAFVLKLAPDGAVLWAKRFGDGADQRAWGIGVTGQGDPVLTGNFAGSINFGTDASTSLTSAGDADMFVARLQGSDGTHVWSRRFGDSAYQRGKSVAVGSAVYVAGDVKGAFSVGSDSIAAGTYSDALALSLATTDGSPAWGKSFHDPADAYASFGHDIAVDSASNVLLTGQFAGTIGFGGGSLTASGPHNGFVAQFTPGGTPAWSKAFGTSSTLDLISRGVAADGANNVLLTGEFSGTADFGGGSLTSAGANDVFVAKLASNGNHLWSRRFGDSADQFGRSVDADLAGDVLVTGYFKGTLDFTTTGTSLPANGANYTLFVAKLAK
jgi:hypothetical protein